MWINTCVEVAVPSLNWLGKDAVLNHHQDVPYKTLELKDSFNCKKGTSENKIIHGDNLEALKALMPEYEGKVKCIYIDPPYNTGNENWVYNDNVNSPKIKKWLGQVVGKEAEDLTRHDKWLCMMYPRLKLLHKLLRDDGAIFISIDDNEQANLKLICDEIFGAGNFVGMFEWESTTQPDNIGSARFKFQSKMEHILFYAKRKENMSRLLLKEIGTQKKYPHQGRFGKCRFEIIERAYDGAYARPTMRFEILGQPPREGKQWQIGEITAKELEKQGKLEIVDGIVKRAVYPEDDVDNISYKPFWSLLLAQEYGTSQDGKAGLYQIFQKRIGFETVKPVRLVEYLLSVFDPSSIILDSFAGSGTTAHAVLNLNKQDGGNRKFILVEMEDYADSITAERVRRVINGYGEGKNAVAGTGGDFNYYELGPEMLLGDNLNEEQPVENIRNYIYYTETNSVVDEEAVKKNDNEFFLGNHENTAYYMFYKKDDVTTLDAEFLGTISQPAERFVIYADNCVLPKDFLFKHNIVFKKIPRDVRKF